MHSQQHTDSSSRRQGVCSRPGALACNEQGFVLAFTLFLLAVCTLIGLASVNMSTDELAISTNEVVARKNLLAADAAASIALAPLLDAGGRKTFDDNQQFVDKNGYLVQGMEIVHGDFLDRPTATTDGGNSGGWDPTANSLARDGLPDLRIRSLDPRYDPDADPPDPVYKKYMLNAVVNMDKLGTTVLPGGGAEFGTGDEAMSRYEITYLFDAKATLPGKDIDDALSPYAEVLFGYRYVPGSGI